MASIAAAYYAAKRLDRFVEAGPRLYIGCRTYPSAKAIGTIAVAAITMRRERIPRLVVKNVISGLSLGHWLPGVRRGHATQTLGVRSP
jgi:hypothetical protein